jgi:arylsulfatase A-like enzyme
VRRAAGAVGVLLLATSLLMACGEPEPVAGEPATQNPEAAHPTTNVLLIVIDTLRADHMSAYGHERPTTPRLAELARESVTYRRAYSQAPWTTPSIGSLLTSRSPTALGIHGDRSPLPQETRLLSEALRDAGFSTGGIVSHDYCSTRWGFARGFDHFDESSIRGYQAVTSQRVTNLGIAFVESQGERPWFLFLHYFDPHFSYVEHRRFAFGGRAADYAGPIKSRMRFKALYPERPELDAADLGELERLYDSEIAFTDHHIGRLLDHLRARGILDQTLVILTADHGEEFLDHDDLGHAKTLYDELVRVPLMLRVPGAVPTLIDAPVGLIDVYPSVLDYLGLPAEPRAAGRSLLRDGKPDPAPTRPVHSETSRLGRSLHSIVEGRHKLVLDLESDRAELYDLRDDPGERRDLAAREPRRAAALRAQLEEHIARQRASATDPREIELSDEERERLEQLGYLETGAGR